MADENDVDDDASPAAAAPEGEDVLIAPEAGARVGLPPGELRLPDELVYAGVPRVRITVYDAAGVETFDAASAADIPGPRVEGKTVWVSVEGLADLALFRSLQRTFCIHPLAMEDALSRASRPKLEVHGDVVMLVAVDPLTPASRVGDVELVSLFVGDGFVLSIEDAPGDTFDVVRKRIAHGGSRLRRGGPDVLFQALIDTLVDRFFPVLDAVAERLEALDDSAAESRLEDVGTLNKRLHDVRASLQKLRRYAAPLREAVSSVVRLDLPHIDERLDPYFSDVVDHLSQVIDHIETSRELAASVRDLQLAAVNTRMNEIMRGLTVISTVFLPLSFVTGVYGMNFDFMPELREKWGYPAVLALMLGVAAFTRWYFKRKRWI